jgi:Restriction alleviation protein Lar
MSEELKPCPFCGCKPELIKQGNNHSKKRAITIKCPDCRIMRTNAAIKHSMDWLEIISINSWNDRVKK